METLIPGEPGDRLRQRIRAADAALHAPELIELEVLHAIRGLERGGRLSGEAAGKVVRRLEAIRVTRYPHRLLLRRVWELRHNLSSYDAAYVALAELLEAPLVTFDRRLLGAPGVRTEVELIQ